MSDANSPEKPEEPLDLNDLDTPSFLRKDVKRFRESENIGKKNRNLEGGSKGSANPKTSTIVMRPNQITSLDSLGYPELDSYQDNPSVKNTVPIVRKK